MFNLFVLCLIVPSEEEHTEGESNFSRKMTRYGCQGTECFTGWTQVQWPFQVIDTKLKNHNNSSVRILQSTVITTARDSFTVDYWVTVALLYAV